jgi:hypothetical protein
MPILFFKSLILYKLQKTNTMKKQFLLFGFALSLLVACKTSESTSTSKENTETWIIADKLMPCAEGSAENCFQVKKVGESSYSLVNATIEGFTYEPDFKYQLVVKAKKGKYELVKELFKVATK